MHDIPALDKNGLRQFGLTTGSIVAGLFGVLLPWLLGLAFPVWPWIIAGILILWALAAPSSMRPAYYGWMRFGLVIGAVMTRLILGIVFYLVVLPIGFVMRLSGKDPMMRRFDAQATTYRVLSRPLQPRNMEKPF